MRRIVRLPSATTMPSPAEIDTMTAVTAPKIFGDGGEIVANGR